MFGILSLRNLRALFLPVLFGFLALGNLFADPQGGSVNSTTGSTTKWTGDAVGGGAAGEDNCVADVNCDSFNLTVNAGDYTGKVVQVEIHWLLPATDYDLYIHKGDLSGPIVATSASGAPNTSEMAAIDPTATGTGLYTVHVVYFSAAAADQYSGSAKTTVASTTRIGTYINGATLTPPLKFSPNKPLKAPVTNSDGEPSNRTDIRGNAYIAGIRGFPAGVDLWYYDFRPGSPTYDPNARNPLYRGQPDGFSPDDATQLGGDGGGDVDLAVGFGTPTFTPLPGVTLSTTPFLAYSSLIAANLSVGNSLDRAQTYNGPQPLGSTIPVDDREWHGAYGNNSVYMLYRTISVPVVGYMQRSNDGGFTYPFTTTLGPTDQTAGVDVNQKTGTVYASFNDGTVYVGEDPAPNNPASPGPLTYTPHQAATDPNGVGHIFCTVKVAEGSDTNPKGIVYLAYSNDHDVFLVYSTDKAVTWSTPVRVSNVPGGTNIFPWIEVGSGSTKNSVGIAWYGTTSARNDDNANWKVYYAFTSNATNAKPTFAQVEASDHFIHASNISEGGLTGEANRNLLDYFQVSFDPKGAAVIGYTDDHNDFFGNLYGTRQISGPSINGGNVPASIEGNLVRGSDLDAQPPQQPSPDGAQVTDFPFDVADALLVRYPPEVYFDDSTFGTFDVRSIKYSSGSNSKIGNYIEAVLHTGDIDPTIDASWRMSFTVNAPFSTLSASKDLTAGKPDYTYGLSDRGDQFWVRANQIAPNKLVQGSRSYSYGTAVRNSDGSITYTKEGDADFGEVLAGNYDDVRVRISFKKLNAILAARGHRLIGQGTTLVGLRGTAFNSQSGAIRSDFTYGGTQYTIP